MSMLLHDMNYLNRAYAFQNKFICKHQKETSNMDLYPAIIHEGDLSPSYSGSDIDMICNEIHSACKGFGTDEKYVLST